MKFPSLFFHLIYQNYNQLLTIRRCREPQPMGERKFLERTQSTIHAESESRIIHARNKTASTWWPDNSRMRIDNRMKSATARRDIGRDVDFPVTTRRGVDKGRLIFSTADDETQHTRDEPRRSTRRWNNGRFTSGPDRKPGDD